MMYVMELCATFPTNTTPVLEFLGCAYKSPSTDKGAALPQTFPLPPFVARRLLSHHHRPTPFFSCIHSCSLATAMESGTKMGEILGPIVLAVVINVSALPSSNPIQLTPS